MYSEQMINQWRHQQREPYDYRPMQQPVDETPFQRFLTVDGFDDANNIYARAQMGEMGVRLGDVTTIQAREQAAVRLAQEATPQKAEKKKKSRKSSKSKSK